MNGLKFVFCEGKDDVAVINGLAQFIGVSDLRIEPFLGKDKLTGFMGAVQTRPEFAQKQVASIGIVRDADEDADAAFQSVRNSLVANGFKSAPAANGGVTDEIIKIGILIIGPKVGKGMLEDLCLQSVGDRPEFICVEEYFQCVAQRSERKHFSPKAKVRVWMASQADEEFYVGKAAEKGYWPWASPVFDPLKQFLARL
jgi:hypothetical protein